MRWLAASVVALLALVLSLAVRAEPTAPSVGDAWALAATGRDVTAVDVALKAIAAAPADRWQADFRAAALLCVTVMDAECAHDLLAISLPVFTAMPKERAEQAVMGGYLLMLHGLQQQLTGGQAELFGPAFPNPSVNPIRDPVLFAELHLLAARQARERSDFAASRDHLDKSLIATLALENDRVNALRLLVRIATGLLDDFEVERAVRLFAAATPLFSYIPPQSLLAYEYDQLVGRLAGYRKAFDLVATTLHHSLDLLQTLELRPALQRELVAAAYTEFVPVELLGGRPDAARALLQSHPLANAREAIVARGSFASDNEFWFAVASEFVYAASNDAAAPGWGDLLTQLPAWTSDRQRRAEIGAFGEAAAGLQRLRIGDKPEARRLLVDAGRKRVAALREAYAHSVWASPMPSWTDRLLLEVALAATFETGAPDYAFVVSAQAVLNRAVETKPSDVLAFEAVQPNEEHRRWAQSLATVRYQQLDWERNEMVSLARRITSAGGIDADASRNRRARLFATGNGFVSELERLQGALAATGSDGVEALADLGAVQRLLRADEALLVHIPLGGVLGKLCIRSDGVTSASQRFDGAAVSADARLVRLALTAVHAPSVEADSQYPVAEAVRLAKLLLGGLESCTAASRRLYVVGTGDVPPAALLLEPPPKLGTGYDLSRAHWLVRDHSFVGVSSIEAFVASRRLAHQRTAVLDYLGVGDPVLSPAPQSAALATRRDEGLGAALANLPELPESAQELERASAVFPRAKVRLLTRGQATEEAFRLEPLSDFDILHFATHGLIRQELPGVSEPALVFSAAPAGDSQNGDVLNDRLLGTSQIASLPLRARLVVLSACNSARYAASIIDNGIQGLSIAFAIAGAHSTIAALWPVESSVARDVVAATFRLAREQRLPIADALAGAMRLYLDGPAPRPLLHPRFWAALVLLGDGALTFDTDGPDAPRMLGPFAPPGSDSDTIVSAAALGADFASSELAPWHGAPSAALVRRRAADGSVRWQASDTATVGAGRIAATADTVYAAGFEMTGEGEQRHAVPVLRAFDAGGALRWLRRLPAGPQSTQVLGLAAVADGSALALVGPPQAAPTSARVELLRVDRSGTVGPSLPVDIAGEAPFGQTGRLAIREDVALAVINRHGGRIDPRSIGAPATF
ncbi:MAG: CHAT domain-containing protein, partial [Alphaproteobacteria bacterium]|nr:CHAT domain-containing protein [Alphaproteobacteria bacterium]